MRIGSVRLWASIGLLVIAAGMPYCAAAIGWAAIQDETTITVRADVAFGVLERSRERELRGFQPESLVRDLVRRVVHRVEGVVPGKSRIVLAVPLDERDRGNPGEAERRRVENGRAARRELRHEWRYADRIAIIRGNHSVPKSGRFVRV